MLRISTFYFLILFTSSCSHEEINETPAGITFFSMPDYMNAEQNEMEKNKIKLLKILHLNGLADRLVLNKPNFKNELEVFVKADINKPALIDKYKVDTLWMGKNLFKVIYTSKDTQLSTQRMSVQFDSENNISAIRIQTFHNSPVAKTTQQLFYYPKNGYKIIENQYFMGKKDIIKVEGFFK